MPQHKVLAVPALTALLGLAGLQPQAALADTHANAKPGTAKIQSDVTLAVYLPQLVHKARFYVPSLSYWVRPGAAIESGTLSMAQQVTPNAFLTEKDDHRSFGLLLSLHPLTKVEQGVFTLTVKYKLLDGKGTVLDSGSRVETVEITNMRDSRGLHDAAADAAQSILADVFAKDHRDAATYPATTTLDAIPVESIVDHEKPVATGTAFYINPAGQLLTAAHVVEDCLKAEISKDGQSLPVRRIGSSRLVDLAALDSGHAAQKYLSPRASGRVVLGEPIVNVGYPLQPLLANSASLTRGNVSGLGALAGSLGQFQFSAPIQSGSSGGPVVSDLGELLGVAQSTLNLAQLAASGATSQNVNFALSPGYIVKFLQANHVAYTPATAWAAPDSLKSNELTDAATVQLSCYE